MKAQEGPHDKGMLRVVIRKLGSFLLDVGNGLRSWATRGPVLERPKQSARKDGRPLAIVAGYFSYEDGSATFGDTEALHVTCGWLSGNGIDFDIACHPSNGLNGVSLHALDASQYDIFVFVCGPWREANADIIQRFEHCFKIGINLSIESSDAPKFDLLYPRDTLEATNADIVFSSNIPRLPLVGICLVHPQPEYKDRQRHGAINDAVHEFMHNNPQFAYIDLDTLHKDNKTGTKTAVSFQNLVSRLDFVISSRLHGMVFSLKVGTPVVAIDPILGGAKVTKQAEALGWPILIKAENLSASALDDAVSACQTPEIVGLAAGVREKAREENRQKLLQLTSLLREGLPLKNLKR